MKRGLFVALGFALLLTGALGGTALAGDGSILVYPSEERHSAEAGEEVEIDVIVSHHGTTYGDGLENVSVVGEYNETLLRVSDVETAAWFETEGMDGEVHTETSTDDPGFVNVSQQLEPPGEGVIGTERFVTITFEVESDAPRTNTTVDFGKSSVVIAGGFPSPIFETNPEISIATTAGESGDADTPGESSSDDDGSPQVPFAAIVVGFLALVAGGLTLMSRRL